MLITVIVGLVTGCLVLFAGGLFLGWELTAARYERAAERRAAAETTVLQPIRRPRPQLPPGGYVPADPWNTLPSSLLSDWQAAVAASEREIRDLTRAASAILPPRIR